LGGGVFIVVNDMISSSPVSFNYSDEASFDLAACKIECANGTVVLAVLYIPPSATECDYSLLGDVITDLYASIGDNVSFILYGDANMSGVTWLPSEYNDCVFDPMNISSTHLDFLSKVHSLGLFQISNYENKFNNVLDVVFTNITSNILISPAVLTLTDKTSDFHHILTLDYFYNDPQIIMMGQNVITESYDFKNADYASINEKISNIPIPRKITNVDKATAELGSMLMSIIALHVPKKARITLTCPPHFDKACRNLRNRRNRAHEKWKISKSEEDFMKFQVLREQFEINEKEALMLYNQKVINKVIEDPKLFWNYVNDKRGVSSYPATMRLGDLASSTPQQIAKMFSDHFASKFSVPMKYKEEDFTHLPNREVKLTDIYLSQDQVLEALLGVDVNKGAGADMIPPIFLRETATTLFKPLHTLFSASLRLAVFPQLLKMAHVTPIFKSGDKADINSYRAISILSSIGKVFERLVTSELALSLREDIHPSQHGFLSEKSTVTNLVEHTSFIRSTLAQHSQVDSIYTDFSSAFDKVDHKLLIFKLNKYGIRGPLLQWIESYLENREQRVHFLKYLSDPVKVNSGVPQGSILGPLLFIIFTNDFTEKVKDCEKSSYADDSKLSKVINSLFDCQKLQESIDILHDWSIKNGMVLNIEKCAVITFSRKRSADLSFDYTIDGCTLKRVTEIRDLGVILDSQLTFRQHYERITNSSRCVLGFVKRRVKELNDPYLCKTLYSALVQPILEYASIVWSPYRKVHSDRIESVQKQFLLFALRSLGFEGFALPSYKSRLLLLNMTTLELRRELASATFIFDLIHNNVDCASLAVRIHFNENHHNLRHSRILVEEFHSADFSRNETVSRAMNFFNKYGNCYDGEISRIGYKNRIDRQIKKLFN
jgi:hypothetical protein